jgi:Peptidase A4 family
MKKAAILIAILTIGWCVPVYAKPPVNGVSVVEPPPPGYDPEASSAAVNAQFALPPEPDATKAPRTHEAWSRAVRAARNREAVTILPTTIFHGPAKNKSRAAGDEASGTFSTTNMSWSGTSVVNGTTSNLEAVTALFIVPTAHQPLGQCADGTLYASVWPGIDGNFGSGAADLLQAGVNITSYCSGNSTHNQYYPWIEWYPHSETSVSSPTINPGDMVFIMVWSVSPTLGYAFFYNYSTDISAEYTLTAPAGYGVYGSSVEWIVERPTLYPPTGPELTNLTNYIAMTWAEGFAWNYADSSPTYYSIAGNPDVGTLEQFTMLDDSGNPISAATIENGSFLWFQTLGSACGC